MIRIVSWNIELARNIDLAARDLTSHEELEGADIILLQEMDPDSTKQLATLLGMTSVYGAPATHPKTGRPFGNAVLSRWPLSNPVEVALPGTASYQGQLRSLVGATVTIGDSAIRVFSIHLETVLLALRRRVEQVRTVADHLAEDRSHPVILGGDFNSASRRSVQAFDTTLARVGLERMTGMEETFRRFGRPYALDHFYARNARLAAGGVVREATASDHQPIWAQVEIGPGR